MLIEISRLAAPAVTAEDDGLTHSIADIAEAMALRRRTRWERRRRIGPLVVGAGGWALGVILMAYGVLEGATRRLAASGTRALPPLLAPDAIPTLPPDPRLTLTVLVASAAWLAVLWLSRARGQAGRVGTGDA
jgi:hypothetical protein